MRAALANYRKNQVAGMSQRQMIILLYDGAIKFLEQAEQELAKESTEGFADRVERVHRIVYHLYSTLDFKAGGEIADKLGSLYSFIISQLYILNSTRNVVIVHDLKEILANLREGWQDLGNVASKDKNAPGEHGSNSVSEKTVSVQV